MRTMRGFGRLIPLLALLAAPACGGGAGGGTGSVPTAFDVYATQPLPGQSALSDLATIIVILTKAVDPVTVTSDSVWVEKTATGVVHPGTLSVSADARRVTWKPSSRMELRTNYTLRLTTAVKDQQQTALAAPYAASYTTGAVPAPALVRQGDFRPMNSRMKIGRSDHTLTLVQVSPSSRYVLVVGGFTMGRSAPTGSAEILDVNYLAPGEDDGFLFGGAGTMPAGRAYHTATAYRPDAGLVLIAGGGTGSDGTTATTDCRIWVLAVNQFRGTGALKLARRLHTATLISGTGTAMDGKVLVTGGGDDDAAGWSAEVFDPVTETWTLLPRQMNDYRSGHQATLLRTGPLRGKVLITGGGSDLGEIFDPGTQTFTPITDRTISGRWLFGAVELVNGQVLLTDGGEVRGELFDPYTVLFSTVPSSNRLERYAPAVFRFTFPPGRGPAAGGPADNVVIIGGAKYFNAETPWIAHSSVEQFVLGLAGTGEYYSSDPAEGGIDLGDPRAFSASCDLGDNRLLVTGGIPGNRVGQPPQTSNLDTGLIFDPQP